MRWPAGSSRKLPRVLPAWGPPNHCLGSSPPSQGLWAWLTGVTSDTQESGPTLGPSPRRAL